MRLVSAKQPALLRGGFTSEEFAAGAPGPRKAISAGSAQGWLQAEQGRTRKMRPGTKAHARVAAGASLSGAGSGHAVSHVFPIVRTQICAPLTLHPYPPPPSPS